MSADPISVRYVEKYRLEVSFDDGKKGVADFADWLREAKGRVKALRDIEYFKRVKVDAEAGTLVWPNGVDICPDVLYWMATGAPIKWATDPKYHKAPANIRRRPTRTRKLARVSKR